MEGANTFHSGTHLTKQGEIMFCEVVINMFYYNTCSRMWPMFPMDDSHDYNVPNHIFTSQMELA